MRIEEAGSCNDKKNAAVLTCARSKPHFPHQYNLGGQIVSYMKHMKDVFAESFDQSLGDVESSLNHMAEDGSHSDDCCLQCAAHLLLLRKIRIICATQSMTGSSFLPSLFHLTSGAMTST